MSDDFDPYAPRTPARARPGATLRDEAGDDEASGPQTIAAGHLRSFIERWERLQEDKQAISDDQKEVMAEAKANGFDTKTIRAIIRLRKLDPNERQEAEALLDLYMHAIGMA